MLIVGCRPSIYGAPAYTAGSNSAPWSRRNVDSAICNTFQISAVACSTFLKRLAAVVLWALGRATSRGYPIIHSWENFQQFCPPCPQGI
jgi:hypothetical protein